MNLALARLITRAAVLATFVFLVRPAVAQAGYKHVVGRLNPVAYFRLGEGDIGDPLVDAAGSGLDGKHDDFSNPSTAFLLSQDGAIAHDTDTSVQINSEGTGGSVGNAGQGRIFEARSDPDPDSDGDGPLDLGHTSNIDITLEAWFKILPDTNTGLPVSPFARIFHYNNEPGSIDPSTQIGGQYAFGIVGNNSTGFPAVRTVWAAIGSGDQDGGPGGQGVIRAAETDAISPSDAPEWHHLVARLREDNVDLFLDGVQLGGLTDSDPIFWQAEQATIGGRNESDGTPGLPFPGLLDEIAIYDGQLSDAEIELHYNEGLTDNSGDFDRDGVVGGIDLGIVFGNFSNHIDNFGATEGDHNNDGFVDNVDIQIVFGKFFSE